MSPRRNPQRHPGAILREHVLPALDLSVAEAAYHLQVTRQALHRVVAGTAGISPDMAARLERLCGIRSQFWLALQHDCELERVTTQHGELYDRIPSHKLPEDTLKKIGAIQ